MIKKVSQKANVTLYGMMISSVDSGTNLKLNITCERLCQSQQKGHFCKRIMGLLKSLKIQTNNPYYVEDKLLMRNIVDNKQCLHTMVLPQVLINQILRVDHDEVGHSGSTRTYMLVHKPYYWKILKASVSKHIKWCMTCQKRNKQVLKYAQLPFSTQRLSM